MATHFRCGRLWSGLDDEARTDQTLVVEDGSIAYAGPTDVAPRPGASDKRVDYSGFFVLPGLIDAHTHCSFGAQQKLEEVDLYAPLELRALRAMLNTQRILSSGYTAVIDPGCTGRIMVSVRDAINSGMFKGPRITCSGPFISTHQGYTAFYPSWFKNPTAMVEIADSMDSGLDIIRRQVKDGVDFIKLAMDGSAVRDGELVSTWTQKEISVLVDESHRLGKRVIAHAKGRDGAIHAARAGVDVIYHYVWTDNETLDAVLENDVAICPSLTFVGNRYRFTQPSDPHGRGQLGSGKEIDDGRDVSWDDHGRRPDLGEIEWAATIESAQRAHAAGVKIMCGTDSGFAITPCGEWHTQEIVSLVEYVGLSPAEALRAATTGNSWFLTGGDQLGALEAGRAADFVVVDGDPLADISILLDKAAIRETYLGGDRVQLDVSAPSEAEYALSHRMWLDIYDQRTVSELASDSRLRSLSN